MTNNAGLYLSSLALSLLSAGVAVLHPNPNMKSLGAIGLGGGIGCIASTVIIAGKATQDSNKIQEGIEKQLKESQKVITEFRVTTQKLDTELVNIKATKASLEAELETALSISEQKSKELDSAKKQIHNLKLQLAEVGTFSTEQAYQIVRQTYNRSLKKLEGLLESLIRNYPSVREFLEHILLDVDSFKVRFLAQLEDYESLNSFNELLDLGLELQERIIDKCTELKVKAQTIVIRYLDDYSKDSIPFSDYETHINNLSEKAREQVQSTRENMALQWVAANNEHVKNYDTEFAQTVADGKYAVTRMKELVTRIESLEDELAEAKKPHQFYGKGGIAEQANDVALYYFRTHGYLLDAINWVETETGYKITYGTRRNPGLTIDDLYTKNSREHVASFVNSLKGSLPEFEFDRQQNTVTLTVTSRRAPQKTTIKDISKVWEPASRFPEIVSKWTRVRITGGSEAGKSPTAENMIVCILKGRTGTVEYYDPMFDSVKNFRTIPAKGKTHEDSIKGLSEYKQLMSKAPSQNFHMVWFDEIDSTLEENPDSSSDLKAILKQASHKNAGLVLTGQNANVKALKGEFVRSDMNNLVLVHIGKNCEDGIANSHMSESEKSDAMKKYEIIKNWCEAENEAYGLTISDPKTYRFAIVIEPNKKPYFIQLPDFGTYTYDQIPSEVATKLICPDCQSENIVSNGKNRKKCNDCGHTFTVK